MRWQRWTDGTVVAEFYLEDDAPDFEPSPEQVEALREHRRIVVRLSENPISVPVPSSKRR